MELNGGEEKCKLEDSLTFEEEEEEFNNLSDNEIHIKNNNKIEEELLNEEELNEDENEEQVNMDDSELEAIKARVREMEEEAEKLKQLQTEVDRQMNITGGSPNNSSAGSTVAGGVSLSLEEKMEVDARSIYVGNVDYGATAEELEQHFHGCGSINRVTILCNKYDGHPKGFAYIEFTDRESVNTAMAMDDSLFRGRQIKVMPKRTNRPGLCRTDRPPRGGGAANPVAGGGPIRGYRGGFRGARGGRGYSRFPRRPFRGRGSSYYSPY